MFRSLHLPLRLPLPLFLGAMLLTGCELLGWGIDHRDFSGFTEFEFQLHPGLGGYPEPDLIVDLSLQKQGPGAYACDVVVYGEWEAGMDSTHVFWQGDSPLTPIVYGTRFLTYDEIVRMSAAFRDVEIHKKEDSACKAYGIDPYWIRAYRWDGYRITDYACSAPRLDGSQSRALLSFLESLLP